jgi:hypothetical protein
VQAVFARGVENLTSRRAMVDERGAMWMKRKCEGISLINEEDRLVWLLSGEYSTKSFYSALQHFGTVPYKFVWKIKIPLRIKTFIWLVLKKHNLPKDVLLQRDRNCEPGCLFFGKNESINHILFQCPLARYLWNVVRCAIS